MLSQDSEEEIDQDLRLNLRYDFGKMNSTLGSVVPLAMFSLVCGTSSILKTFLGGTSYKAPCIITAQKNIR